jgi:hypothetical protein
MNIGDWLIVLCSLIVVAAFIAGVYYLAVKLCRALCELIWPATKVEPVQTSADSNVVPINDSVQLEAPLYLNGVSFSEEQVEAINQYLEERQARQNENSEKWLFGGLLALLFFWQ